MRLTAECYLAFLHGLEQGALHFRGCAVDFIREDDVCKNRSARGVIFSVARIVDQRADDISREKVGRELHAG